MHKASGQKNKDKSSEPKASSSKTPPVLMNLFVPFSDVVFLAKRAVSELLPDLEPLTSKATFSMTVKGFINVVMDFIQHSDVDFFNLKKILAAFAPIHSYFMALVFGCPMVNQNPFVHSWRTFSIVIHICAVPCAADCKDEFEALKQIFVGNDSVLFAISTLEDILVSKYLSFNKSTTIESAMSNFSSIIGACGEPSSQTQQVLQKLNKKMHAYLVNARLYEFVENIDQIFKDNMLKFKQDFSNEDKMWMIQSAMKFSLYAFRTTTKLFRDKTDVVSELAQLLSNLSKFVYPHELKETTKKYKNKLEEIASPDSQGKDESIKYLHAYLNSKQSILHETTYNFDKFYQSREDDNKSLFGKLSTISKTFEKFISFYVSLHNCSPPEDISVYASSERVFQNYSSKMIIQKLMEDAEIIDDHVSNVIDPNSNVLVALGSLMESIEETFKCSLLNQKYLDLIQRFGLIARTSKKLLELVSPSLIERTTQDFCKYFPPVLQFKDLFEEPELDHFPRKGRETAFNEDLPKPQDVIEKLNLIMLHIGNNPSNSIADDYKSRLNIMARFLYRTSHFFDRYIQRSPDLDSLTLIIKPTKTTKTFEDLIEALIPISSDSITLSEQTFGLVLIALYQQFASEQLATQPFKKIIASLMLPPLSTSVRRIPCIISTLQTMQSRGEISLSKQEIDEIAKNVKSVFEFEEGFNVKHLIEGIAKIKQYLPSKSIVESLESLINLISHYSAISSAMNSIASNLGLTDVIGSSLVHLLLIAQQTQTIENIANQLRFQPLCERIKEKWPLSTQLFADAKEDGVFEAINQFIIKVSLEEVKLPEILFYETAIRTALTLTNHKVNFLDDDEILKPLNKFISFAQARPKPGKHTNTRQKEFAQKLLSEMFKIIIILESRPITYATTAFLQDLSHFQTLTLEFLSFCELKGMCRSVFRALGRLPKTLRPEMPPESKFFPDVEEEEEPDPPHCTHNFDNSIAKLQKIIAERKDEKSQQILDKLRPLLDKPRTDIDPPLVALSIQKFLVSQSNLTGKLSLKRRIIQEELAALAARRNIPSQIQTDSQILCEQIQAINSFITQYEAMYQKNKESLAIETDTVNAVKAEIEKLKKQVSPDDLILPEMRIDDDDDSNCMTMNSDNSPTSKRTQELMGFVTSLKDQNAKLKSAIRRATISQKIPIIAGGSKYRAELSKKIEVLNNEIQVLQNKLHGLSLNDLQQISGIKPVEINQNVIDFIHMADQIRAGRGNMVNIPLFISNLDHTEKYIYELSQNRREYSAYISRKI